MFVTLFLWITGLGWLGYGAYCFFVPGTLTEFAGLVPSNTTAMTELRAMYGGLQGAIGILALIGATHTRRANAVLLALSCVYAGLGSTRTIAALLAGDSSMYSIGALSFECLSAAISIWLLRKTNRS